MEDETARQEQDRIEISSEDLPEDTPALVVELGEEPEQARLSVELDSDGADQLAARRELQQAALRALQTRARPRATPYITAAALGLGVGLVPALVIVFALRHQQALLPAAVVVSGAVVAVLAWVLDRSTWRAWVTWIRGPAAGIEVPLRGEGPWYVGSRRGAHIRIKGDPSVSLEHACLRRGPDGFAFEDLSGAGSSKLNQTPVQGPQRLCDGDVISVGESAFVFHFPWATGDGGAEWTQRRNSQRG